MESGFGWLVAPGPAFRFVGWGRPLCTRTLSDQADLVPLKAWPEFCRDFHNDSSYKALVNMAVEVTEGRALQNFIKQAVRDGMRGGGGFICLSWCMVVELVMRISSFR